MNSCAGTRSRRQVFGELVVWALLVGLSWDRMGFASAFPLSARRNSVTADRWSLALQRTSDNDEGDGASMTEFPASAAARVPVTPCTRICRYNANVFDGQVCIGCFRETFEIGSWESMQPMEKYYALLDATERFEEVMKGKTYNGMDETTTGISREKLQQQAEFWKTCDS